MPTYVYKFIDTGETIEVQQAFTDEALTEAIHPSDGKPRPVKKVFTPVGVTFKGSGFYKTDSAKGSTKSGSTTDTAGSASSNGGTGSESSSSSDSTGSSSSSSDSGTSSAASGTSPSSAPSPST